MSTAQTTEYNVHLSQQAINGMKVWQASVESLPNIRAEGESCDAVLQEVARKLRQSLGTDDIVLVTQKFGQDQTELRVEAQAKGHKLFGVFENDPEAMEVFDEIERQRAQHIIGG